MANYDINARAHVVSSLDVLASAAGQVVASELSMLLDPTHSFSRRK